MRNLLNFLLKYNDWLLFALLEVISLALLFQFNHYQGSVYFTSANRVVGGVYSAVHQVSGYFHLKSINEDLMERNVRLELETKRLEQALNGLLADSSEIVRLREDALNDYEMYKAEIVNNSITQTDNYITIDKGAVDGIRPEMGVITGNGIVGIVYLTSDHYSVVISVLNTKSSISCKVKNSDYFGFLKWDGGSSLYAQVKDLPRHALLEVGDTVVTSGHSAVFPPGIPVGKVESMKESHDGLSYQLNVQLFTDFAKLNEVRVISRKGQQEQLELEQRLKPKK